MMTQELQKKTSPFASYSEEYLAELPVLEPLRAPLQLWSIERMIMSSVNEMLVATPMNLYQHFHNMGLTIGRQLIQNGLQYLTRCGYLRKLEFRTPHGVCTQKLYKVSNDGGAVLRSLGRSHKLSGYVDSLDAEQTKRLLSAWQLVLALGWERKAVEARTAATICAEGVPNAIFRNQVMLHMPEETVLVESVRSAKGAATRLFQKLERMEKALSYPEKLTFPVQNPLLVIVAEDREHMLSLMEQLKKSGKRYCFRIAFSNDLDAFWNPSHCISNLPAKQATLWERLLNVVCAAL